MTENRHDPDEMNWAGADERQTFNRLSIEYLNAVYVVVKNGLIFAMNNPALHQACARAAQAANAIVQQADGTAAIAFSSDGVYVNRALVRLGGAAYEQGEYLHHVWRALGVGEIIAFKATAQQSWMGLVAAFKDAVYATPGAPPLSEAVLDGIRCAALDDAGRSDRLAMTRRFRALRAYSIATIMLRRAMDKVAGGGRIRIVDIKRPLQEMISAASDALDLLVALTHMKRNKEGPAHHAINTAVLVIAMTRSLGLRPPAISELALQAALHDLGRFFVGREDPANPASARERRAAESIAKLARNALVSSSAVSRVVVANEHRLPLEPPAEGSPSLAGRYPFAPLAAARLVAVARAYDSLTTPKRHRPALMPDEALRMLVANANRLYDETAVKLLINELGVFPIGSTVALSDGRIAVVLEAGTRGAHRQHPRVKLVRDRSGIILDGAILDLAAADDDLRALSCVGAEEHGINAPAFLLG